MSADSWRGRRVDRFEVTGLLGKGATGAVYRARDLVAGREVALKVLLHTRLEDRHRARFRREGELTAALDHPGIVRVHSAGELPGGAPFLAYELVEGARSLADACAAEPDLARRVAWVRDAAQALGVAHARGIVHRDVKPDNLLVDAEGRLKVADFGAAWCEGAERLTLTGGLVGTPYFMSPEQLAGAEATPATDVWALGVTLYSVLTGEYPFDAASIDELRMKVIAAEPVAPRRKTPGVSPAIERVCLHCLEKAPSDRYPHGAALAADLDRALAGAPVIAPRARWRGSRRALLLVATPTFAIAGVVAAALLPPAPPPEAPAATATARAPAAPIVTSHEVATVATATRSAPPGPRLRPPGALTTQGASVWAAAMEGEALFMNLVGDYFRAGEQGFPVDYEQALRWYERGAELGEVTSMVDLAELLLDGDVPPDPPRAVELYRRAAALDEPWAHRALGHLLLDGREGVPADWAKAAEHLERAARVDANQPRYLRYAGDAFRTGGPNLAPDLPRAVALYEEGVERGDPGAMRRLAALLAEGRAVARDLPRARSLLERAAGAGDEEAVGELRALPAE